MNDPKTSPDRQTRAQVLALRKAGVSVNRIAVALGISTQRVYQHLEALRATGDLPARSGAR